MEEEPNHENAPQNLVDEHVMARAVMPVVDWPRMGVNIWEMTLWLLEVLQLVGH